MLMAPRSRATGQYVQLNVISLLSPVTWIIMASEPITCHLLLVHFSSKAKYDALESFVAAYVFHLFNLHLVAVLSNVST